MSASLEKVIRAANAGLMTRASRANVDSFFTDRYVAHFTGRSISGRRAIEGVLQAVHAAFADVSADVEILLAGRERIAWQRTLTGKHKGAFQGFPASGKLITWRDMVVSRFEAGLIAEEWVSTDLAEQLLMSRKS